MINSYCCRADRASVHGVTAPGVLVRQRNKARQPAFNACTPPARSFRGSIKVHSKGIYDYTLGLFLASREDRLAPLATSPEVGISNAVRLV